MINKGHNSRHLLVYQSISGSTFENLEFDKKTIREQNFFFKQENLQNFEKIYKRLKINPIEVICYLAHSYLQMCNPLL